MGSTSDKISGKANEIAGKTKQAVGKATDDREMQAKGAVQKPRARDKSQPARSRTSSRAPSTGSERQRLFTHAKTL